MNMSTFSDSANSDADRKGFGGNPHYGNVLSIGTEQHSGSNSLVSGTSISVFGVKSKTGGST